MKLNHHKARERIKTHLKRVGNQKVAITPSMVNRWWRLLNDAVFFGKVPTPNKVELIRHKTAYAWITPLENKRVSLTIQPTFVSRKLFLMILVHELVHAWDHYHDKSMMHGTKFMSWAGRIQRTTALQLKRNPDERKRRKRRHAANPI